MKKLTILSLIALFASTTLTGCLGGGDDTTDETPATNDTTVETEASVE